MEDKKLEANIKNSQLKNKLIIATRMRKKPATWILVILIALLFAIYYLVANDIIIKASKPSPYTSTKKDHTKISFMGDVSASRYLKEQGNKLGKDVFYSNVKDVWKDSDKTIANLEASVVEDPKKYDELVVRMDRKKIYLDVNKSDIVAMKNSGIDLIGYANNHAIDYGVQGMLESLKTFEEIGIDYVGAGYTLDDARVPYTFEVNGKKVSITAITDRIPKSYTSGVNLPRVYTTAYFYKDYEMKKTFSKNDINIVFVHWGTENGLVPEKEIREMGRKWIDLGADLIIGSHTHVLMPVEKYKDGIIAYSLGNLVFDQMYGRTTDSTIANFYQNDKERYMEFVPIRINNGVPYITDNQDDARRIFNSLTKELPKEGYKIENGKLRIDF